MARGGAQTRRKRTKADAARRRRRAQSSTPVRATEQTLFFTRLRRQAKWVFVFLALVFAVGFVIFGVGSGGGVGLGDLFGNGNNTKSNLSESSARKRIQKNPKDAQAYRDLAQALQADGDMNGAIDALKHATQLQPKNTGAMTDLAGLYTSQGARLQNQITSAQVDAQDASFASLVNTGVQLKGQQIVGPNEVFQAVTNVANDRLTQLYRTQQDALTQAETLNKQIVRLKPRDALAQLSLGQSAQNAGDVPTAIAAYEQYVKLTPADATTAQVKQLIAQLRKAAKQQSSVQGG